MTDDLISRKAAIRETWKEPTYSDPLNVLTEVRDRIEQLPSAQSNVHVSVKDADCISRQAAIKAIEDLPNCYNGFSDTYDKSCIIGVLEELPSAQERKTGRWIKADTHNYLFFKNDRIYKCSNCGRLLDFEGVNGGRGDANFCPNCGCKMGVEHEAD